MTTTAVCPDPLPSPTPTSASFDFISLTSRSRSSTISDLEEEIVWSLARCRSVSGTFDSSETEEESEDDFVVLGRRPLSGVAQPATPPANSSGIPITDFARLSLNNNSVPTPHAQFAPQTRPNRRRGKKRPKNVTQPSGLGERPIVDDASEIATEDGVEDSISDLGNPKSAYEEAVQFVTMFLTNPSEYNTTTGRLTLLQSIIIELGLSTVTPSSMASAKALLKSQAFVNVRDYLTVREQGLEAIQSVMHPSRSALARSIKKSKKRVSIQWIKDRGLDVFLIPCYYH